MEKPLDSAALVVGGGPAGLFLAGLLAGELRRSGIDPDNAPVILAEKGAKPGRKLLASGAGQCNLTNAGPIDAFLTHYGERGRFMRKALHAFDNEALVSWFGERGLECRAEEGGKIFPATRRATDVLRILLAECERNGVRIEGGRRVTALRADAGAGFIAELRPAGAGSGAGIEEIVRRQTRLLAITTGGRSYPGTGAEGEGYALASALGHSIVQPRPALTAILARDFAFADLAGLSFEGCRFSQWRGGRKLRDRRGDLLITHEGLSGPGILDASRDFEVGDRIEVDFTGLGREAFARAFAERLAAAPRAFVKNLLPEFGLPRRMAERFCGLAGVDASTTASELRREKREALVDLASSCHVTVAALGGWDRAMVTAGGVDTSEVDPSTMGSRVADGLYFAGELLDIDGDTGGYNLQAAFSTAFIAARSMAKRIVGGLALSK